MARQQQSPALLPAGRTKWLWLAVAGALGLWLLVLLLVPGRDATAPAPSDDTRGRVKSFDTPAAEAFSSTKRPPVKASQRLPPFPALPDRGKSE